MVHDAADRARRAAEEILTRVLAKGTATSPEADPRFFAQLLEAVSDEIEPQRFREIIYELRLASALRAHLGRSS